MSKRWLILGVVVALMIGAAVVYVLRQQGAFEPHNMMGPVAIVDARSGQTLPLAVLGVELEKSTTPLVIKSVPAGTGAAEAGLKAGDVIVQINALKKPTLEGLRFELRDHRPGDVVMVRILRDGEEKDVSVRLMGIEEMRKLSAP